MESIFLAAAVLACPVGMGAMMWFMARGKRNEQPPAERPDTAADVRAGDARETEHAR